MHFIRTLHTAGIVLSARRLSRVRYLMYIAESMVDRGEFKIAAYLLAILWNISNFPIHFHTLHVERHIQNIFYLASRLTNIPSLFFSIWFKYRSPPIHRSNLYNDENSFPMVTISLSSRRRAFLSKAKVSPHVVESIYIDLNTVCMTAMRQISIGVHPFTGNQD